MDLKDGEILGGTGLIAALVAVFGYLRAQSTKNADSFQNSQQRTGLDLTATLRQERDAALARADIAQARVEELIRDMHEMTKASDAKINKLEMDLHESLYKRKVLLNDFDKLARIVRSSDRKEVLEYIQHTEFGSLGD